MTDNADSLQSALGQLARENAALRQRLARHELRRLLAELSADPPFALDIVDVGAASGCDWAARAAASNRLPRLPLPSGAIQKERLSSTLPAIAIHDEGMMGSALANALAGLFKTQYQAPFARLLFLCSHYQAVPLLGRYGYGLEHIGERPPGAELERLHARYGVTQIRALGSGKLIAERAGA